LNINISFDPGVKISIQSMQKSTDDTGCHEKLSLIIIKRQYTNSKIGALTKLVNNMFLAGEFTGAETLLQIF
jgi:hypothetical protein